MMMNPLLKLPHNTAPRKPDSELTSEEKAARQYKKEHPELAQWEGFLQAMAKYTAWQIANAEALGLVLPKEKDEKAHEKAGEKTDEETTSSF